MRVKEKSNQQQHCFVCTSGFISLTEECMARNLGVLSKKTKNKNNVLGIDFS